MSCCPQSTCSYFSRGPAHCPRGPTCTHARVTISGSYSRLMSWYVDLSSRKHSADPVCSPVAVSRCVSADRAVASRCCHSRPPAIVCLQQRPAAQRRGDPPRRRRSWEGAAATILQRRPKVTHSALSVQTADRCTLLLLV